MFSFDEILNGIEKKQKCEHNNLNKESIIGIDLTKNSLEQTLEAKGLSKSQVNEFVSLFLSLDKEQLLYVLQMLRN